MASNLLAMASNLLAMASNPAMASHLLAMNSQSLEFLPLNGKRFLQDLACDGVHLF